MLEYAIAQQQKLLELLLQQQQLHESMNRDSPDELNMQILQHMTELQELYNLQERQRNGNGQETGAKVYESGRVIEGPDDYSDGSNDEVEDEEEMDGIAGDDIDVQYDSAPSDFSPEASPRYGKSSVRRNSDSDQYILYHRKRRCNDGSMLRERDWVGGDEDGGQNAAEADEVDESAFAMSYLKPKQTTLLARLKTTAASHGYTCPDEKRSRPCCCHASLWPGRKRKPDPYWNDPERFDPTLTLPFEPWTPELQRNRNKHMVIRSFHSARGVPDHECIALFANFLSQMLEKRPERRALPEQLLEHPFLTAFP